MDIPSNLPFTVRFLAGRDGQSKPVNAFFTDESRLDNYPSPVQLRENSRLEVQFIADDDEARFYMDGLELLADKSVELDHTGTPYLEPSSRPYVLYTPSDEYYPYIPGFYRIKVVVQGQSYVTSIQIVPSRISVQQWEIMRDELEVEVRGLAQAIVRKNLSVGDSLEQYIPAEHLHRFLVIRQHFPTVMAALADLVEMVNYRIRTEYRLLPVERVKAIDEVTIRHRLTHPDYVDTLKAPVRDVDYNLPENQWIARIVSTVRTYLDDVIRSLDSYRDYIQSELNEQLLFAEDRRQTSGESAVIRGHRMVLRELDLFAEHARKMLHSVQLVTRSTWYESVRQTRPSYVPHVLLQDPRYRALYRMYRDLHADNVQVKLDPAFAYQWKRTDLLYELWGFLKLCTAFSDGLSFVPKRGWIYDSAQTASEELFVPVLMPDTFIVLEKEEVRVHLVYNATLPSRASQTNLEVTPMHMPGGFHNRPDARIDVFHRNVYCGSVMMDFKYRHKSWFWNPNPRPAKRPPATNQLISYSNDSKSSWLLGGYLPPAYASKCDRSSKSGVSTPETQITLRRMMWSTITPTMFAWSTCHQV
ncbi:hypothetical protein [Alicyclobacillus fastidiosus]|uniref:hypothetical protein n=1 Tax=Alicyclobacillus fastidiosus TaxID=392011 RepID=UPI0023E9A641|nr:hypothetical protein [Alicyclobacillus fastidiosus]GMA60717.1 hypothetical protein GCM10025859_11570 [Alicyclobacillus fastidiosus]